MFHGYVSLQEGTSSFMVGFSIVMLVFGGVLDPKNPNTCHEVWPNDPLENERMSTWIRGHVKKERLVWTNPYLLGDMLFIFLGGEVPQSKTLGRKIKRRIFFKIHPLSKFKRNETHHFWDTYPTFLTYPSMVFQKTQPAACFMHFNVVRKFFAARNRSPLTWCYLNKNIGIPKADRSMQLSWRSSTLPPP